jgi:hypothetical protein
MRRKIEGPPPGARRSTRSMSIRIAALCAVMARAISRRDTGALPSGSFV